LGGYQEAESYLTHLVHLDEKPIILREPPPKSWVEHFVGSNSSTPLGSLSEAAGKAADALLPMVREGTYYIWK
jgi:hypothetical protein